MARTDEWIRVKIEELMPGRIWLVCTALALLTGTLGCDRAAKSTATAPTNQVQAKAAQTTTTTTTTNNHSHNNPVETETTEQHKERMIRELLQARQFSNESYERDKQIFPAAAALDMYRRNLERIEGEAKYQGVQLPPISDGIPRTAPATAPSRR
jgi:hypothetical protein